MSLNKRDFITYKLYYLERHIYRIYIKRMIHYFKYINITRLNTKLIKII